MRLKTLLPLSLLVVGALVFLAWRMAPPSPMVDFTSEEITRILQLSPLPPVPEDPSNGQADNPQAADLGRRLFFHKGLSPGAQFSCATCHQPEKGWSNGQQFGQGVGTTRRHVPTLWNVAYNRWFFWDGRADTLWAQALRPIEDPLEMGSDRLWVAHAVGEDIDLRKGYQQVFGPLPDLSDANRFPARGRPVPGQPSHPLQQAWQSMSPQDQTAVNQVFANVGKAIAAFERRIVTREAPFDVFVEGLRERDQTKLDAISESAQRGLKLFIGRGQCRLCHNGPNFSDSEFHNLRLPQNPSRPLDNGRYGGIEVVRDDTFNAAGPYSDDPGVEKVSYLDQFGDTWGQFKTPTLRNVALTAPYTHEGIFPSLEDVIHFYSTFENAAPMGHHDETFLVPLRLSEQEKQDLIAFLQSLTQFPPRAEIPGGMPAQRPAAEMAARE
ncbi:MAG TPA: cytochrome c peroxidase [Acidobacteriota bacterium]|nr:cytochrome c peroxidase [Acidobacteriota bacterium]